MIIIGHNNADADSIVSSLVLADFLKKRKIYLKPKRTGDLNKEIRFILKKFNIKEPGLVKNVKCKKIFLVDHGSYEESAPGAEQAEIIGVLDHHKLGGLKTINPIFYRAEPVGATSTILTKMFLENKDALTKKQAGLLLCGILSDTLNLSSPTTTIEDKKMVKILADISNEKPKELAKKLLEIKSDISDISTSVLIKKDYKESQSGKTKFGIAVCETLDPAKVKERDLVPVLAKLKKQRKVDLIFFSLIDILKNNTEMYLLGEKEVIIAEKTFNKKSKNQWLFLPGISSRKKQILPPFVKYLEKKC